MTFTAEDVQRIVSTAVREALQQAPKQTASTSGYTIMDHLNSRIPKFTFKPENGHTFEKWYARYAPILESEGGALAMKDTIRFVISKLNSIEYDAFVNHIKPVKIGDLSPDDAIEQLTKLFCVSMSLFKRRIESLNIKRSGRTLKELTGVINEAAEDAEWGGIQLDEMKQYILMLSLMNSEDNDIRARAARLMEEDIDYFFPEVMDDLENFEQLKNDLAPSTTKRFEINPPKREKPKPFAGRGIVI
ncbi:uncharacterized protein LOC108864782 [Galendromus occidentalis]|uniref:Uncharacterized protein LOC108864782 n=1 Tax=Galendromus occidentalis TaxID=34638 RepID=A0AAJ7L5K8_9ACAR|nr:uncharacterized protein LOC108864782 [Galendromus occidentalis]